MNNIILEALKLQGHKNAEAIIEIINCCPNPVAAAEMILGVHNPPEFTPMYRKHPSRDCYAKTQSIDYLMDTITLNMYEPKTKRIWFLTEEDFKANINGLEERPSKYYDCKDVKIEGFTSSQVTLEMKEFANRYINYYSKEITHDEFMAAISAEEQVAL